MCNYNWLSGRDWHPNPGNPEKANYQAQLCEFIYDKKANYVFNLKQMRVCLQKLEWGSGMYMYAETACARQVNKKKREAKGCI